MFYWKFNINVFVLVLPGTKKRVPVTHIAPLAVSIGTMSIDGSSEH